MTTTELQQAEQDLAAKKKDLATQISAILGANMISSKGKNRVFQALVGFPDIRPTNITDSTEAGLVSLLFEVKNVQIAMYTIRSAIEQANQKGE